MSTIKSTYIQKVGVGTDAFELPANDGTSGQYLQTNGSGTLSWQTVASLSNAEDGTGTNFEFNSGFGSNGVAYGVRAWINFDGSGTPGTGRANGNMDAVTDNGTGDYTCNFTTDMPDANYVAVGSVIGSNNTNATNGFINAGFDAATGTHTTSAFRFITLHVSAGAVDYNQVQIAVIR